MKKLMVLGASYSQIPLMRAAKRRGVYVIAVSIPGPYAGFEEADEVVYADITDPEAVLRAAAEKKIDGITTCCMDLGTLSMGYVCEKLGLPGPSYRAVKAASDKAEEKQMYAAGGVPAAKHVILRERGDIAQALQKLTLPVMVKAVDLTGSRGISRADTEEEVYKAFDYAMKATNRDFCIMEEFIDGTMFGVEAMMDEEDLSYCLILGNDMKGGNPSFPTGHFVPYQPGDPCDDSVHEEIRSLTKKVAETLGFKHCAMDLDCMWKDGKPYVIEATCRAGATCITDTVSLYYGFDYFEAIVAAALGEETAHRFNAPTVPKTPSVTRLLASPYEGVIKEILCPESLPENVVDLSFNIAPGEEVHPMSSGRDRIGQLIIKGTTVEECRKIMTEVMKNTVLVFADGRKEPVC